MRSHGGTRTDGPRPTVPGPALPTRTPLWGAEPRLKHVHTTCKTRVASRLGDSHPAVTAVGTDGPASPAPAPRPGETSVRFLPEAPYCCKAYYFLQSVSNFQQSGCKI